MKKRLLALSLALLLVIGLVGPLPIGAENDDITVKLHYHRPDGHYENWDVWFWIDQEGAAYPLKEEDGEMVATFSCRAGTTRVGYIVRRGEWEEKDIPKDQFIELTGILSGTVHVYVEAGVEGHRIRRGTDVITGVAIRSARYNGETVELQLSEDLDRELTKDTFQILCGWKRIPVSEAVQQGRTVVLTPKSPLDLSESYTLRFDKKEYEITMPDYYSSAEFEKQFTYQGEDLGPSYTAQRTVLRLWAPTAKQVSVNLFADGDPEAQPGPDETLPMTMDANGTWVATLEGDRNGTYYTYTIKLEDRVTEAVDPYARAVGINGQRAMILDLNKTNPEGWDQDADPNGGKPITDAVIYEVHVRDLTMDESSGVNQRGKYLGLIETGTKTPGGMATGLDHIKKLGITHVQLQPVYDFGSVDERGPEPQYNWGYDPVNYNVPEGSYSSDPYHGEVRVREFKQMVQGLHNQGLSVVMDVVYNHVYDGNSFCMNQIVPGYFSRPGANGSSCGNDTASERAMVRKYIVDSVRYWVEEYHIDGFRFDLAGLLDVDTVNEIVTEVHKDHPNVIFYGEGWNLNTVPTKEGVDLATQSNADKTPNFGYFSDDIRNLLGGSPFNMGRGYVSGAWGKEEDLQRLFLAQSGWTQNPCQTINYAACHDNYTLLDRITLATPEASEEGRIRMHILAAAIYLTAQGVPFIYGGEDFLRSKPKEDGSFDGNSYKSPDEVNSIKWSSLENAEGSTTTDFYRGLIAFRKAHPILRMTDPEEIKNRIVPITEGLDPNVVAFRLNGEGLAGETAKDMLVIFNAGSKETTVTLPDGVWGVYAAGQTADVAPVGSVSQETKVAPISAMILIWESEAPDDTPAEKPVITVARYTLAGAAVVGAFTALTLLLKKKKK